MNHIQIYFPENKINQICQCETEMSNEHLYEYNLLNISKKKVDYSKMFEGRLCGIKYLVNILKEKKDTV